MMELIFISSSSKEYQSTLWVGPFDPELSSCPFDLKGTYAGWQERSGLAHTHSVLFDVGFGGDYPVAVCGAAEVHGSTEHPVGRGPRWREEAMEHICSVFTHDA